MKDYKKLNLPLLTKQDEEYQMLIDISDLYRKQKAKTAERKSGDATEIAVRNYLLSHGLRMALNPELSVKGYTNQADLVDGLLLKDGVNQNKLIYAFSEIEAVIEIKNNGVANQSANIHRKFIALRNISESFRFAVIVVSERLLSPTPYCYAINEEAVDIEQCKVFTCILRRNGLDSVKRLSL